jgi:hypothetical protein
MAKINKRKFYFNPETTNYEEIRISFYTKIRKLLYYLFSGITLGIIFFFLFVSIIKSPKEKEMMLEKKRIEGQYKALLGQISELQEVISDLQQRDNNIYRSVLQADPIPYNMWKTSFSNADYYNRLLKMTNSQIVVETTQKVNQLRKQLYVQSKSFDEIVELVKNKDEMLKCIPAIQPVLNKDLSRVASGWGYRMDPIYHTSRFHEGMDFAAPVGTDVYVTGNGKVIETGWVKGYGNTIKISHGFGYATLYAHLSEIKVKTGQSVMRGDVIALVGNTGKSSGPHLHYEVHYKDSPVNPQNFYFLDLTPDEYDRMIQLSANSGLLLD